MNTPTLDTFTELYRSALKAHRQASGQTSTAVLDLCLVVYNARETLDASVYDVFTRNHKLTVSGEPTLRLKNMLLIGKRDALLRPLAEHLPASISSLRRLSSLHKDALTGYVRAAHINPLMTNEEAGLLVINTRKRQDPKSTKSRLAEDGTPLPDGRGKTPRTAAAEYTITLKWFNAEWSPAKGRAVRKTLDSFLRQHAQALGLFPDAVFSVDAELSMLSDERKKQAA